jgi:hypothetical protein
MRRLSSASEKRPYSACSYQFDGAIDQRGLQIAVVVGLSIGVRHFACRGQGVGR